MSKYDEDTLVIKDKIYIPVTHIDVTDANDTYTKAFYDEKTCRRCPVKAERHSYECDNCEAYKGTVNTSNVVYKNGIEYFGAPLGDRLKVEKKLGIDFTQFNVVDLRIKVPFDYPIKMHPKFALRDYQAEAVESWYEIKHGLIVAPPRSGKTPTMLFMCIDMGYRTILLASQHEFLNQFIEHIEEFTNLPALERKTGKKLYGFPKNIEDFDTLQIAVCTYQQFMDIHESGKKRFKRAIKNFGTLMVDEVHKANANEFAKIVNSWPSRVRLGVTGTDKRKDGRHIIVEQTIGPVAARIEIDQLQAKLLVHVCDYVKTRSKFTGPAGFVYAVKFLAKHEKRNEEILEYVGKDLAKGHSIIIPAYHKEYIHNTVNEINFTYGEGTAEAFVGGGTKKNKELRNAIIERCRSGQTKVVVGVRSILQLGHNVPKWSALYYVQPMSNEPNWKQESSRILTPLEGKRQPIIRMFVEPNVGLSLGCFIATYKASIKFKHVPTEGARRKAADMIELHSGSRTFEGDPYGGLDIEHEDSSDQEAASYGVQDRTKKKKKSSRPTEKPKTGLMSRIGKKK